MDATGNHKPIARSARFKKRRLHHLKINVSTASLWAELEDPGKKSKIRKRVAKFLALNGLGLSGRYDYSLPKFEDRSGDRLKLDEILVAMHYDSRVIFGASREKTMPVIEQIAHEIAEAPSYEAWRESQWHKPLP